MRFGVQTEFQKKQDMLQIKFEWSISIPRHDRIDLSQYTKFEETQGSINVVSID